MEEIFQLSYKLRSRLAWMCGRRPRWAPRWEYQRWQLRSTCNASMLRIAGVDERPSCASVPVDAEASRSAARNRRLAQAGDATRETVKREKAFQMDEEVTHKAADQWRSGCQPRRGCAPLAYHF